jgi:two-component system OmpR family response regulator
MYNIQRVFAMISINDLRAASIKVLVIEDDKFVGAALVNSLERSGMQATLAGTAAVGLALKRNCSPDIVLVDLTLPDMDGINLVKLLVDEGDCGIIIVSGADDETDRVVALEIGADDYVVKPPLARELQARIRAVHRRLSIPAIAKSEPVNSIIQLGKVRVDLANRLARSEDGNRIALTNAEFVILQTLIAANGEAVSRDLLSETALRHPWHTDDRGVDQLIFSLRQKLASVDGQQLIHSVRGAGYLLTIGTSIKDHVKPSKNSIAEYGAVLEETSQESTPG